MILWLDDNRAPWKHGYIGAEWAKTYDEAVALLLTGRVTFASLDHDLSEKAAIGRPDPGEKTGGTLVRWLAANPQYWPVDGCRVHSFNPVGKADMLTFVRDHYGREF